MMCHLANEEYKAGQASGNTGQIFLSGRTGLAMVHWIGYQLIKI